MTILPQQTPTDSVIIPDVLSIAHVDIHNPNKESRQTDKYINYTGVTDIRVISSKINKIYRYNGTWARNKYMYIYSFSN